MHQGYNAEIINTHIYLYRCSARKKNVSLKQPPLIRQCNLVKKCRVVGERERQKIYVKKSVKVYYNVPHVHPTAGKVHFVIAENTTKTDGRLFISCLQAKWRRWNK